MLINSEGIIIPALIELARMQDLDVDYDSEPKAVNALLQEKWVKAKQGVFRAELEGRFPTDSEYALLKRIGCIDAISLPGDVSAYQSILLLGATMKAMARRFRFVMDERLRFPRSHRFPTVTILTSRRKIIQNLEDPNSVPLIEKETGLSLAYGWRLHHGAWPTDETEVARFLISWSGVGDGARFDVFSTNDILSQDGKTWRSANTADTVKCWMSSMTSRKGDHLVLSSQPYCENQLLSVRRAARASVAADAGGYSFNVCGPEAPPLPLSRFLDNIAKQFWEEVQLLQN